MMCLIFAMLCDGKKAVLEMYVELGLVVFSFAHIPSVSMNCTRVSHQGALALISVIHPMVETRFHVAPVLPH